MILPHFHCIYLSVPVVSQDKKRLHCLGVHLRVQPCQVTFWISEVTATVLEQLSHQRAPHQPTPW